MPLTLASAPEFQHWVHGAFLCYLVVLLQTSDHAVPVFGLTVLAVHLSICGRGWSVAEPRAGGAGGAALEGLHASVADLAVANSAGPTPRACHGRRCGGLPVASDGAAVLPAPLRAQTGPATVRPQAEGGLPAAARPGSLRVAAPAPST